jgi:hypothetical protein
MEKESVLEEGGSVAEYFLILYLFFKFYLKFSMKVTIKDL